MYPGAHAAHHPDRPAIIMAESGRTVTYLELETNSVRIASALYDLGLRTGDVVGLVSDNAAEALEVYWAAVRSGLYITAVNSHLNATESAFILRDSAARVVVASAGVRELAGALFDLVPEVAHWYAFGGDIEHHRSYDELLALAGPGRIDQLRGSELLYSSGTTGKPKGIKPPLLGTHVDEGDPLAKMIQAVFDVGPGDVYLSPAPIYHSAPLKWCPAVHALGGTVVIMERFDAEKALAAIERYQVTVAQVVPTMMIRMLQLPEAVRMRYDVSSLRTAITAAAPCPAEVKDAIIGWWGPVLYEYYGATEAHGITVISASEWQSRRGSVGKAVLGVLRICDDNGSELSDGAVGTIYFERDNAPFEYLNDAEKTASSRHPDHDNWTTVGDIGYRDADGYLYLTDRKTFTIISGGVNIYPREIEDVLSLHPKVFDVAVIGVPDPVMGEQVKAVVQLRGGITPSHEVAEEIIDYAKDRVARYKAPRSVDFVEDLPRLPTGKLAKKLLASRYVPAGTDRD